MTKQQSKNNFALPKAFWLITIFVIITIVTAVSLFLYWRSGWPNYKAALEKCNNRPPIQATTFISTTYKLPSDKSYNIPGGPSDVYFCTESEAIKNGFHHALN